MGVLSQVGRRVICFWGLLGGERGSFRARSSSWVRGGSSVVGARKSAREGPVLRRSLNEVGWCRGWVWREGEGLSEIAVANVRGCEMLRPAEAWEIRRGAIRGIRRNSAIFGKGLKTFQQYENIRRCLCRNSTTEGNLLLASSHLNKKVSE